MRANTVSFAVALALIGAARAQAPAVLESVQYVRPAGKEFVNECVIITTKHKKGSSVTSITERGKTKLTVSANHDAQDRLTIASVTLVADGAKKTVTVLAVEGKGHIRIGATDQEFDLPKGVIVTSAPDWNDAFLLCQRYDRQKGGKQTFPGLWIHPESPGQRLTFAIERLGDDVIQHDGKNQTLDRCKIWLRGNSEYLVWANADGRMIKLVTLPYKDGATNWIVLKGYEKSTSMLVP